MSVPQQTTLMVSTKASPASQLILEDALKKCLSKTGTVNAPTIGKKNAPRSMHSPFGDFPKEHMPKKEPASTASLGADFGPMTISGAGILKKGSGLGGKTSSKNKKEEEIKVNRARRLNHSPLLLFCAGTTTKSRRQIEEKD